MKKIYLLALGALSLAACSSNESSETTTEEMASTTPTLEMLWESDTTLVTPESVIYDSKNDVYYVSCINGVPPSEADGDGYISKLGTDGKVVELKWVTGLSAPKGMAIVDDVLYVTDIKDIVAINIADGSIKQKWTIDDAEFLNDAAAADNGDLFFTDSNLNTIHKLSNGELSVLYKDDALGGSNGIYIDGDTFYVAGFMDGKFQKSSIATPSLTLVADSLPGGDGVEKYQDGFFVSNWNGEVSYVDADGMKSKLIDTKDQKINAADIEVVADKNVLLIPTFFANKVVAYTIK